jgi:hypothetical protein
MSVPSRIHLPFTHLSTNGVCDKAYTDTVTCRFPATLQGDPETIFSYTTDILRPFNICHCTFTPLSYPGNNPSSYRRTHDQLQRHWQRVRVLLLPLPFTF